MTTTLLSTEERARFAAYCDRVARDENGISEQMKTLHLPAAVVDRYKQKALAYAVVAQDLKAAENMTINP